METKHPRVDVIEDAFDICRERGHPMTFFVEEDQRTIKVYPSGYEKEVPTFVLSGGRRCQHP